MKKIFFAAATFFLAACNPYQTTNPPAPVVPDLTVRPKNIILLIGDGMGLTQITAGMYANQNKLNLEQFPVVGLHKSYSRDNLITDSAAGATAFACGVKTYNGAIGVDHNYQPVKTILEEAEENGRATGLIATSSITHATPACFIAHVKSRKMMEEIALDFLKTDLDFLVGGGWQYFRERRMDQLNLYAELTQKGYFVSDLSREKFTDIAVDYDKNFAYFTAQSEPPTLRQGRDYLIPATRLAPVFLTKRSAEGFFLMIEGAQIDWGGHANDSDYIISEMIEFDKAIGAILDFAKENRETLVIVTADHETGGYAINPGSKQDSIVPAFTTDGHTGALIPVFAFGPGAELFAGIYENTAIYHKMRQAFGFQTENTQAGGR